MRCWILPVLLLLAVLCGPGCTTNPATGNSQVNMLVESREIAIGEEASPEFLKEYGGDVDSPQILQYVRDIGHRLAKVSERPDLPWEFHVTDSSVINAFALPGGKVFITRGLMKKFDSEAQLAGVLGHEVGHVTAQHIGQQMTQGLFVQVGLVGIGLASGVSDNDWVRVLGMGASTGGSVYLLSYGRKQEIQADKLGLRYMTKLGYSPVAQIQVMRILGKAGKGPRSPEFFSTHPYPENRIKKLEEVIPKRYPNYKKPGAFHFKHAEYKAAVLDRFKKMPPPKHLPKAKKKKALIGSSGHRG